MKNDDLLNFACSFDWITPSIYILQDFWNRPASKFGLQAGAGFDRGDIRRILKKSGVKSWGYVYSVDGDMIMLSVPQKQANWAHYLFVREGVPVLYAPDGVTEQPAKKRTVLGWLLGW